MKNKILLLVIQVGLLTACQQTNQKDDPEKLKAVLTGYFDGIRAKDPNKLNELTTNDYVLFESGLIWNNDSLANIFKKYPTIQYKPFKLDNFRISVDNEIGHMTYYNHGEFTINDTTKFEFDWLESANFRKVDGKWKIDFLHSTQRK